MSAAQRWKGKLADIALREGKGVTVQVPLDELRELVRDADALAETREALQQALRESGCDGDLCAHDWHEAARAVIAREVPR